MKQIRLMAGIFTVGFWTLMSRVLGFARDILFAAFLGSGPVYEAFLVAFSLPNMFRRFFAEGAFNVAFVPMFSKKLEADDDPKGFAQEAVSALATVLIALMIVALLAMPWLVLAMASGFAGDDRFDLAVDYGRIAFPYILFISLAALLSGLLNATGRFWAAAAAPVLLNILFVSAMIIGWAQGWDLGLTLAWTVPIAGVAQLAFVWEAARRAGFKMVLRLPRFSPEIRRLAVIAAPAALAAGVVQVNLLVGRQVASFFDGAIVWLSVADRLYQLPLGVVGIAIGIVLLPSLSRRLQAGDEEGGRAAFNRATELSLALTLPAAVALIVIPLPLVSVLFQRGAFTGEDAAATAVVLAIYGAGLPAFVLQKVLQPLFYAREDTKAPFRYAVVSMVVNALVAIGLAPVIGYTAAALATTLAAWVMVWLLWRGSRRMGPVVQLDDRFRQRIPRVIVSATVMGIVLFVAALVSIDLLLAPTWRYLALAWVLALGVVSYFTATHLTGALRLTEVKSAMRRGGAT